MRYLKLVFLFLTTILVIAISIADCEAGGRTGSHRVGGYTSHGKGSHYIGGHCADCEAGGRTGSHRVGGYTSHGKGSHYIGGH
jgi:hypothetical protein